MARSSARPTAARPRVRRAPAAAAASVLASTAPLLPRRLWSAAAVAELVVYADAFSLEGDGGGFGVAHPAEAARFAPFLSLPGRVGDSVELPAARAAECPVRLARRDAARALSSPEFAATLVGFADANDGTAKQAVCLALEATKEVVVAFRGTSTVPDVFATDLSTDFVRVASGSLGTDKVFMPEGGADDTPRVSAGVWAAYANGPARALAKTAADHAAESGYRLVLTGHSLGGSIAACAALDLLATGALADGELVTFGSPNLVNAAARDVLVAAVDPLRVVVAGDATPAVPPEAFAGRPTGCVAAARRTLTLTATSAALSPDADIPLALPPSAAAHTSHATLLERGATAEAAAEALEGTSWAR